MCIYCERSGASGLTAVDDSIPVESVARESERGLIITGDMDVDENVEGRGGAGSETDIEQSLLQQFSCLGTTDKEDLVRQLQKLIGSQLNENTASFFLDMNNW